MGFISDIVGGFNDAVRDVGNAIAPGSGNDLAIAADLVAAYYLPGIVGNYTAVALFDAGVASSTVIAAASIAQAATTVLTLSALGESMGQIGQVSAAQAQGILINTSSNVAAIPVIYGARRVGGTRVLTQVSGANNEYLHLVIVLCEGEIDSVTNIYIDGVLSTDAKFTGLLTTYVHTGTDSQTADANLIADLPAIWSTAYPGSGIAYIYAKLKFDRTAFSGFPTITADVQGRKVYDPRTTLTAYSANPALCIRDYLTNVRYGRGIATAQIDDAAITTAANYCDALVTIPSSTQARYTCNGVVNTDSAAFDNIKQLLSCCRSMLVYSAGKYKLICDALQSSTFSFNEDNITGSWSIATAGRMTRINRVTATFYDPASNWQPNYGISDSSAYRSAQDNGMVLEAQSQLPFTTNLYMAQQLAGLQLKQSRFGLVVSFKAFQVGLRCEVGDVVDITHSTTGWSGKLFRITKIDILDSEEVDIVCTEYDATVYNLDTLTALTSTPTLSLPSVFTVPTPATLTLTSGTSELLVNSDGTITSRIKCVWPAPSNVFASTAEIQYQLSGVTTWQTFTLTDASQGVAWVWPVQDGQTYTVRIRFVNTMGIPSLWIGTIHTAIGKTAPPTAFDFFNILVQPDGTRQYNFGYNSLAAQPNDWMGAEIRYVSGTTSTPNWATMSLLQDATTYYTNSPVELNAPLSGVYTFACKSLDTTGNESAYLVRNITLPARRLGNVFDEFFEGPDGWLGVKTGCSAIAGILEATDSTTWATAPATWAAWSRWNTSPTSPITYESPVRDFGTVIAGQVNATVDADGTMLLEIATSANGTTWSAYGSGSAPFSTRYLKVRLTVTATGSAPVPVIRTFNYQINAPIKSEYINDLVISSLTGSYRIGVGDIRIPLAGTYAVIKRTTVVIQDGSAGQWTYARQDQTLTFGPRWQFRLNGVLADPAFVDFFIEGY